MNRHNLLCRDLLVSVILLATTLSSRAEFADPTPAPKAPPKPKVSVQESKPKPKPKPRPDSEPEPVKRSATRSPERSAISSKWLEMGVKSVWRHNGSTMGLIVNGSQRTFVYISVSSEMQAHVSSGASLFEGSIEGNQCSGTAHRFRKGLPPLDYRVEGSVINGGTTIELRGMAPKRDANGTVTQYVPDLMRFDLIKAVD